jgi:site-specific DNA-methyltransferase (adenine-specific)
MDKQGRLFIPNDPRRRIQRKRYLDELQGDTVDSLWDDIPPVNSQAKERLGYPTQKPVALLERIVCASTKTGDVVLDPFCGCGTAIEAAHKLSRRWIGIDVTYQAMRVIREERLTKLSHDFHKTYEMIYRPRDLRAAEAFAVEQPFAFQDWAVEQLGGIPTRSRSGDRGIDGRIYFQTDTNVPTREILVSVKGGKLKATFVRELQSAVARERAPMGILVTLKEPSKQMLRDVASSGFYTCPSGTFPKVQFITVHKILSDVRLDLPPILVMDEVRKRALAASAAQLSLPGIAS